MKYRNIFAALTAVCLMLSRCAAKPAESNPAQPAQGETSEAVPLGEDTLTLQAMAEPLDVPDYFGSAGMETAGDGYRYLAVFSDMSGEKRSVVQCDAALNEVSKTELAPLAPYDGFYSRENYTVLGDDVIYMLVTMENHNNINPADAQDDFDQDWWENYNNSYTATEYFICTYAMDGTMLSKAKVDALNSYMDEYHSLWITECAACGDQMYLFLDQGGMLRITPDGSLTEVRPNNVGQFNRSVSLIRDRDGKPVYQELQYASQSDGTAQEIMTFYEFDGATGEVGKQIYTLETSNNYGNMVISTGGYGDYRFFVTENGQLCGIRDDGTAEPVIDWAASDLMPMGVYPLQDGSFLAYSTEEGSEGYYRLTRLHSSELREKQTVTIGVLADGEYLLGDI
ncbi:MAG: hypothetical protein IKN55_08160, partial [Oscillospiraceae bacterium]|nr:hypothetical protein [Oscillospiraceae bacterium]